MSGEEIEILTTSLHMRWTVDTREDTESASFRFNDGEWRLCYCHVWGYHLLLLQRMSADKPEGDCPPHPFDVSVQVETGGTTRRIVEKLSAKRIFKNKFAEPYSSQNIWIKRDAEIQRAVPEFAQNPVLTLIVDSENRKWRDAARGR